MLMCRWSHMVVFWLYLRCIWDVRQCNTMMCRCSHVDRGRGGSLPMAGAGPLSDISFKVLTIIIINIVNIITKIQTNKTWLDHYQTSDSSRDYILSSGPGWTGPNLWKAICQICRGAPDFLWNINMSWVLVWHILGDIQLFLIISKTKTHFKEWTSDYFFLNLFSVPGRFFLFQVDLFCSR